MTLKAEFPCPCWSKKLYKDCCKPFHEGQLPQNALQLMRSRYAAYALGLCDYIIHTTHPSNSHFQMDMAKWVKDITNFHTNTQFENLEILDFQDGEKVAFVTFVARLKRGSKDSSFTEKSRFEKIGEKWYYLDGNILSGKALKKI